MKKLFKLGLIMFLALGLVACGGKETVEEGRVEVVNAEDVLAKIENKDSFVFILTQTGCSHCQAFEPHFTEVAIDKGVVIYQLIADQDASEDKDALKNLMSAYEIEYTPTTIVFDKGAVENSYVGDMSEKDFIAYLKEHKVLK